VNRKPRRCKVCGAVLEWYWNREGAWICPDYYKFREKHDAVWHKAG